MTRFPSFLFALAVASLLSSTTFAFEQNLDLEAIEAGPGIGAHWAAIQKEAAESEDARVPARDEALRVAKLARADGNEVVWGAFAELAVRLAAERGQWQFIEDNIWDEREALLSHPDGDIVDRANMHLMDYAGMSDLRGEQERLAARHAKRIAERMGEGTPAHIQSRIHGGESFLLTGDPETSIVLLQSALNAARLGTDHAATAHFHKRVAETLWREGQIEAADAVYRDGLASEAVRHGSGDLGQLWWSRSRFLAEFGEVQPAAAAAYQANGLLHQHYGEGSEWAITGADQLAATLSFAGAVASGLNVARLNYDEAWEHLGDVPLAWRTANNYAEALRMVGRPDLAAPIDEWLLERRVVHYGEGSIQALVSASNAALNRIAMGEREVALTLLERQRSAATALADPTSEHVAQVDAWTLYLDALHASSIEDDALETLASYKDWAGSPDILSVRAATLAATEHARRGEIERSVDLLGDAERISSQAFHPLHPETFAVRLERARILAEAGDARATESFVSLEKDLHEWTLREVGTAGDRSIAEATRVLADDILHAFAMHALKTPEAVPAFTDAAAMWETLTDREAMRLATHAHKLNADDEALVRNVLSLRARTAELLSSSGIDDAATRLLAERQRAEADLARRKKDEAFAAIVDEPLPSIEDVLGENDLLVNFVSVRARARTVASTLSPDLLGEPRLLAIVREKGQPIALHDLGSPDTAGSTVMLANALSSFGTGGTEVGRSVVSDVLTQAETTLLTPFAEQLRSRDRLFIVPAPELYALPWAALENEDGVPLAKRMDVRILAREDALHRIETDATLDGGDEVVLVGDVLFGDESLALPGTGREVRAIADTLGEANIETLVLADDEPTEARLNVAVRDAELVHLATHGFFLPSESYGTDLDNGFETGTWRDALWRGGIMLAGATDMYAEAGFNEANGIAHAREMMDWSLAHVELAVLSACETGLGAADAIEALRGLPSALRVAGVRRSLVTLWPVDDRGTANFMVRFHEHVARGTPYAEALRLTRLEAIDGEIEEASDPSLWAAFTLIEN